MKQKTRFRPPSKEKLAELDKHCTRLKDLTDRANLSDEELKQKIRETRREYREEKK